MPFIGIAKVFTVAWPFIYFNSSSLKKAVYLCWIEARKIES